MLSLLKINMTSTLVHQALSSQSSGLLLKSSTSASTAASRTSGPSVGGYCVCLCVCLCVSLCVSVCVAVCVCVLGVLMWEVFTEGKMPFEHNPNHEVVMRVSQGHRLYRPRMATPNIYDIMQLCWHERAEERPSFSQISILISAALEEDSFSSA
ncbi:unnamed protein product [Oncorhynchus mykiss]|uniref:Tyrosine-protein kinase catalytic domain-containing protein n=1 Tax=Oncorhynchus mykiss TaxID=8022 RepID=A0A060YU76_ONCMY|nr:unnamed protein product [Oncorhynchus mykiss]